MYVYNLSDGSGLTPGFRVFESIHEEDNRLLGHGFSSFLAKKIAII